MARAQRILIYVLRHDLRLADNPVFNAAASNHQLFTHLIPLFIFDPLQYEPSGLLESSAKSSFPGARSRLGRFWRCGPHRARFLAESFFDLKKSLQATGSDLVIRAGKTHIVVGEMMEAFKRNGSQVQAVWMTKGYSLEEVDEKSKKYADRYRLAFHFEYLIMSLR